MRIKPVIKGVLDLLPIIFESRDHLENCPTKCWNPLINCLFEYK